MSLSNQDVGVRVSCYPRQGYTRGSPRGTIQVVREPHDTEGVRCTLARITSVMYGIVLGVTPPGALRKMNQDNECLFNANRMNELMHVYVCYDYNYVYERMDTYTTMLTIKST
jgi:hypothetical protein